MRLIDGDYLYDKFKANGIENIQNGEYVLKFIEEEPTVDAIPRDRIDEMIAEIDDISLERSQSSSDGSICFGVISRTASAFKEDVMNIIHKYCDKEQTDEVD